MHIYDDKKGTWVPYVPDIKKLEQQFMDISRGGHDRMNIKRSGPCTYNDQFKIELITPQAQGLEMAKSELKRLINSVQAKTSPPRQHPLRVKRNKAEAKERTVPREIGPPGRRHVKTQNHRH